MWMSVLVQSVVQEQMVTWKSSQNVINGRCDVIFVPHSFNNSPRHLKLTNFSVKLKSLTSSNMLWELMVATHLNWIWRRQVVDHLKGKIVLLISWTGCLQLKGQHKMIVKNTEAVFLTKFSYDKYSSLKKYVCY